MKRKKKTIYFIFLTFLILTLVGFYLVLNEINTLRNEVRNLEVALEMSKKESEVISEATSTDIREEPLMLKEEKISVIPTAIIFETLSSPLLEPQTKITLTIESISKRGDGRVDVHIRAFTSEATAYSAIQPQNFFELIDLAAGGQSIKPVETIGAFDSIPPKSAVSGRVTFKIAPEKNSIILQLNYDNTIKYYELDFNKKTYKETAIG